MTTMAFWPWQAKPRPKRRKVYASRLCAGCILNTHKSVYILYQIKAEIIYLYQEVIKICNFMRSDE